MQANNVTPGYDTTATAGRSDEDFVHLSRVDIEQMEIERKNAKIDLERKEVFKKLKKAAGDTTTVGELFLEAMSIVDEHFNSKKR